VQKKPSPAAARRPLPPAGEVSIRLVGNDKATGRRVWGELSTAPRKSTGKNIHITLGYFSALI
jgi:hypothetical protein